MLARQINLVLDVSRPCVVALCAIALSFWSPVMLAQSESPETSLANFCKKQPRLAYTKLPRLPEKDPWFELYRVAPGVTAIYEPHQWQEVISYLIEGDKQALLFDSGNGIADIAKVVKKLTDKPVVLLNSHSHYDHVGGNYQFADIAGLDTAFSLHRQKGIDNADIRIEVSPPALCKEPPKGVTEASHIGRPYKLTQVVQDGHQFDLGGRTLELIRVAGHTPDAIVLIDREAGLMWTGDSYYSGPIWLYAPETDLAEYAKSLDRMLEELPNLKALLPAHNTPWVEPEILKRVKRGFENLLANKLEADPKGDGTVIYTPQGESEFSFLLAEGMLDGKK